MGNSNKDDYNRRLDTEQKRSSEMDSWLRNYFSQDRERANALLDQAGRQFGDTYNRYGENYNAFGDVARTGYREEFEPARKGYEDFAAGWTPLEKQQFRAHSIAPALGFWKAVKMEDEKGRNINPYSTGGAARDFKTARQAAYNIGDVGLGAEVQGRQLESGEKQFGLGGLESIGGKIAGFRGMGLQGQQGALGGQLNATSGLAGIGSQFANMSNQDLNAIFTNMGISNDLQMRLLDLRSREPSTFDRIMKVGDFAARAAAAYFTMGGSEAGRAAANAASGSSGSSNPFE
jgi:hypothetical protein